MNTLRLKIEKIREADFEKLLQIYNHSENMKFILTGKWDYTLEELKSKWNELKFNSENQTGFKIIKLKNTNQIIGECGLLKTKEPISKELEIAYMIDEKYWKMGLGSEICEYLINNAFQKIGTEKIIAGMYRDNESSIRLIEKFGFKLSDEGVSKSGIHFKEFTLENPEFK
jgi:ribosomal-protein-alanine N-acetyltransferase